MCSPTYLSFLSGALVAAVSVSALVGTVGGQTSQLELAARLAEPLVAQKRAEQLALKNRVRASKTGSTAGVPASERAALVDLYHALNGDQWVENTNWLTNQPVSTWEGVVVVDDRVEALILDSNRLTGKLPAAIGQLRAVRTILLGTCLALCRDNATKNNIGGVIPPQLNLLRDLETLDLADNQFGGQLPFLGDLSRLEFLDLGDVVGGNNLTGTLPDWLGDLTTLQTLLLADNQFRGEIPFLGRLTSLTHLDLSDNELTGEIPDLRTLKLLKILTLGTLFGGNKLKGDFPNWLGQLTSLTNISMASQTATDPNAGLSGVLPDLSTLTDLQTLSLSGNRLRGPFPVWIAGLSQLQFIDLGVTFENDDGTVRVGLGNEMTGSVPDLSALSKLRVLTLSNNNLGPDIGPIDKIASIEIVLADSNDFVDLPDMNGLLNLEVLDVRRNRLTFEDIRPNVNVANGGNQFLRTPQQRVPVKSGINNGEITLSIDVGGADNTTSYKWFRDDQELTGEGSASIQLVNDPTDEGIYHAEATDSDISGLTLESRRVPLRRSLVVNSPDEDRRDHAAPIGVCDTGQTLPGSDVPECTFAAAIQTANQLAGGADITIEQLPPITIARNNPLPAITRSVVIDDSGANTIIRGVDHPEYGLRFDKGVSTLRGLSIAGFNNGVHVTATATVRISDKNHIHENGVGVLIESSANVVVDNTIFGNTLHGIEIRQGDGSALRDNKIVDNNLTDDPLVAGTKFNRTCITVRGGFSTTIDDNHLACTRNAVDVRKAAETRITRNHIGLNDEGDGPIRVAPGHLGGVFLFDDKLTVIRDNFIAGISSGSALAVNSTADLSVLGNKFGTDLSGRISITNTGHGISLFQCKGTITVARNTISSSLKSGVEFRCHEAKLNLENNFIGTDSQGNCDAAGETTPCPLRNREDGVVIRYGSERIRLTDNSIGWNDGHGVHVLAAQGTVGVLHTKIFRNRTHGVRLKGTPGKFVAFDNEIVQNDGDGILATDVTYINLRKNEIGGESRSNRGNGVFVDNAETVAILGNSIISNELNGVYLDLVDEANVRNNKIKLNKGAGIVDLSDSERGRHLVSMNDVSGNGSASTGIHIVGPDATIRGNVVSLDAGDGIALDVSGTASVTSNNIFLNEGLGLNNLNPSNMVMASGNWWGNFSGPSGEGPGTGDEVSAGVDYSGWLTEEAAVVIGTPLDPVYVPAADNDTLLVFVQNWSVPDDVIDVSVSETGGWYVGPADVVIGLLDSLGVGFEVPLMVPSAGPAESSITFTAVSRTDPSQTSEASLSLLSGARMLSRLSIGPDSVVIAPDDSIQFAAVGYDQFDDIITLTLEWLATGGSITQDGLFTAGPTDGIYQVSARHEDTGIEASAFVEVSRAVAAEESADLPRTYELFQSYPNPFNPTTTIAYSLPRLTDVTLAVYDMLGRLVAVPVSGARPAGSYRVEFDASNLPSGVYIYRLEAGDYVKTRTMVVIK